MDEHNIQRPFSKLRWVGDEDRHVWIYKQNHEDTKKYGRSKEPLINLVEMWTSARILRKAEKTYPGYGPRSHDKVCEHERVTYPFNDHFLWHKR